MSWKCGWLCVIDICLRIGAAMPPASFVQNDICALISFHFTTVLGFDEYLHCMWFQPCHILFHMIYLWLRSCKTNVCFELLVLSYSWCVLVCVSVYLFACYWNVKCLVTALSVLVGRVCWSSWLFWNFVELCTFTFACCVLLLRCLSSVDFFETFLSIC